MHGLSSLAYVKWVASLAIAGLVCLQASAQFPLGRTNSLAQPRFAIGDSVLLRVGDRYEPVVGRVIECDIFNMLVGLPTGRIVRLSRRAIAR